MACQYICIIHDCIATQTSIQFLAIHWHVDMYNYLYLIMTHLNDILV